MDTAFETLFNDLNLIRDDLKYKLKLDAYKIIEKTYKYKGLILNEHKDKKDGTNLDYKKIYFSNNVG